MLTYHMYSTREKITSCVETSKAFLHNVDVLSITSMKNRLKRGLVWPVVNPLDLLRPHELRCKDHMGTFS